MSLLVLHTEELYVFKMKLNTLTPVYVYIQFIYTK